MEYTKLKKLLKEHNHVLIDYTDKFINDKSMIENLKTYLEFDEKTRSIKYDHVVFLLDVKKLEIKNYDFYHNIFFHKPYNTLLYIYYIHILFI